MKTTRPSGADMTCQSPDVPSATNESERLAPVGGTSTCDASKIDERVVGGCETTAIGDDPTLRVTTSAATRVGVGRNGASGARGDNAVRVGLDLVRATSTLRSAIMERLAASGLPRSRIVVTTSKARSPLGSRELPFVVVDIDDAVDLQEFAESVIPMDRIVAGQWWAGQREPDHIHVLATGLDTWLVVQGGVTDRWDPVDPNGGGPSTVDVLPFSKAA